MDCEMCLLTPYNHIEDWVERTGISIWALDTAREDWRFDEGSCDCECSVCTEVRNGDAVYAFRYTDEGRETQKILLPESFA